MPRRAATARMILDATESAAQMPSARDMGADEEPGMITVADASISRGDR